MSSPIGHQLDKERESGPPAEVRVTPSPAASRPQQGVLITLTGGGLDAHHVTSLDGGQTWRRT